MSRVPLPLPAGQSFLQGLISGEAARRANAAIQQAQNQSQIAQQALAIKQRLLPAQLAALSSGAANKTALTTAAINELNAKMKALGNTSAMNNALVRMINSGGSNPSPSNTNIGGGTPSATSISVSPTGNITAPNGNVYSPTGTLISSSQQNPLTPAMPSSAPVQTTGGFTGFTPQEVAMGAILGKKLPLQGSLIPPLNPEQKSALAVNQANAINQNATNTKAANNAFALNQIEIQMMDNLDSIEKMAKTDPGMFYPGSTVVGKIPGISDAESNVNRGALTSRLIPQIMALAHQASVRGGIGIYRAVTRLKPSADDLPSTTLGKIYGMRKVIQQDMLANNQLYQKSTGQPMNLPNLNTYMSKSYKNPAEIVQVRTPEGKVVTMSRYDAEKLGASEPGGNE